MEIKNIINTIDSLAPLSDAIVNIQKLYTQDTNDLNIDTLVSLIESDALLSVNILKIANSSVYGFSSKISSVSQAVTLFGIMQIYGFIMSYVVSKSIRANTEIFGYSNEKFNDVCNIQSALLLQWYSKIDLETARFLAPLALIMETGKLVIATEVIESSYEDEFRVGYKKSVDIQAYEKEILGKTSYELSSMIFKHWNLEPIYIKVLEKLDADVVANENIKSYVEIMKIIIIAANVKSVLTKESVLKACSQVKGMGLDPNEFANVALKVKKAYINGLKKEV